MNHSALWDIIELDQQQKSITDKFTKERSMSHSSFTQQKMTNMRARKNTKVDINNSSRIKAVNEIKLLTLYHDFYLKNS